VTTANVLVVDDEQDVRRGFVRALTLQGYSVWEASSANEALQMCDAHHFDVVVLDFIMPGLNGVELLVRLRRRLSFIRSIVISGKLDRSSSQDDISKDLREAVEADVYLHKPVSNDGLIAAVQSLTSRQTPADWQAVAGTITGAQGSSLTAAKRAGKELKKKYRRRATPRNG
jgi:CheY-like chemotaxis protein